MKSLGGVSGVFAGRLAAGLATGLTTGLTTGLATGLAAGLACASGVGGSYFQPGVVQAAHTCATGECRPGAPCTGCSTLGRQAGVDPTGLAPCTPDGACRPARQTWGYHQTRWRRWPGDYDSTQKPTEVDTSDSLLKPFDAPEAKEEDVQAPPPVDAGPAEEEQQAPATEKGGRDLNLPALPEPKPTERRLLPSRTPDAPPALPFGALERRLGPSQSLPPIPQEWRPGPSRPPLNPVSNPVAAPRGDAPPSLPEGFTSVAPSATPRRLPATLPPSTFIDPAVRTVSDVQPLP
ncbi:MAG: hypothetical protein ACRCT8_05660 [Lacipirellulaceae bacterium]